MPNLIFLGTAIKLISLFFKEKEVWLLYSLRGCTLYVLHFVIYPGWSQLLKDDLLWVLTFWKQNLQIMDIFRGKGVKVFTSVLIGHFLAKI